MLNGYKNSSVQDRATPQTHFRRVRTSMASTDGHGKATLTQEERKKVRNARVAQKKNQGNEKETINFMTTIH
jgi:hypothetical protein